MSKPSTVKQDRLREMREANFARTHPPRRAVDKLKADIAKVPAKRAPKAKRGKAAP